MDVNHGSLYISNRREKTLLVDSPTGYWKVIDRVATDQDVRRFAAEVERSGVRPPEPQSYNSDVYPLECVLYLTNKCNLGCGYCYSKQFRNQDWSSIDLQNLEKAIDVLFAEERRNRLNFLFFGGETFLAVSQLRFAIEHINALNRDGRKTVTFSITTNGTLVNKEIVDLIEEHDIRISISFDGPEHVHNKQRRGLKKPESHHMVMRTIDVFREHGIPFGTISTVGDPDDMDAVYDYFLEEEISRSIKISPIIQEGAAKEFRVGDTSRAEYSRMWGVKQMEGTRRLVEHNKRSSFRISEGNVVSMVSHLIMEHRPDLCLRSPCGAAHGMVEFHPDGRFVTCDKTLYSPELGVVSHLDDMERGDSILAILDRSPLVQQIRSRTVDIIPKCSRCAFKASCGGSCTLGAYDHYGSFLREDSMCEYREVMFEELMWLLAEDKNNLFYLGVQ